MRRILSVLALSALLVMAIAPLAFAKNSGEQPPGPPASSGGLGADVFHCRSDLIEGTRGVIVINNNHRNENCT